MKEIQYYLEAFEIYNPKFICKTRRNTNNKCTKSKIQRVTFKQRSFRDLCLCVAGKK